MWFYFSYSELNSMTKIRGENDYIFWVSIHSLWGAEDYGAAGNANHLEAA